MKIELETWRDVKHTACLYAASGVRRRHRKRSVATLQHVQRVQLPLFPEARDNPVPRGSIRIRRMKHTKLNFASPVTPDLMPQIYAIDAESS